MDYLPLGIETEPGFKYVKSAHILICQDMCMTVHKVIAFFYRRQIIRIIFMTVSQIQGLSVNEYNRIIGKDGKFKHHLVYFRIAVTSYAKYLVFNAV